MNALALAKLVMTSNAKPNPSSFVVFAGVKRVASGCLGTVVLAAKRAKERGTEKRIAFYDAEGRVFDVDLEGTEGEVVDKLAQHPAYTANAAAKVRRGRGRPKLGVVSREVSLLPRHWAWLSQQPSGASAALRRLVDAARKQSEGSEELRQAIDRTHRFLWDIAGDRPGFEEATRALFAKDFEEFRRRIARWPVGIRTQVAEFLDGADDSSSGGAS